MTHRRIQAVGTLLLGATLGVHSARAQNFSGLSFPGDGTTLSGLHYLDEAERRTTPARFAATASARGDAQHSIPIPLPAALLSPTVSLTYQQAAGDHSWVARDWSLDHGLPTITRVIRKEHAQAYTDVDEVYRVAGGGWNGIIWRNGTGPYRYSSSGTIEGTIQAITDGSGDPAWELSRGGVTTRLEPRNDVPWSQLGVQPVRWYPVECYDSSGNTMSADWEGSRLEALRFGGHCAGGCPGALDEEHTVQVDFRYTDPSGRKSTSTDFTEGVADVRDRWLDAIDVQTRVTSGGGQSFQTWVTYDLRGSVEYRVDFRENDGFEVGDGRLLTGVYSQGYVETTPDHYVPLDDERVVATMAYTQYDPTSTFSARGVPAHLDYRSTLPIAHDNDDQEVIGSRTSSFTAETIPIVDYSGDGLPDFAQSYSQRNYGFYEPRRIDWMIRDDGGRDPTALWYGDFLESTSETPGTASLNHPLSITAFCETPSGANHGKTGRYGVMVYRDVDGDGAIDVIRSDADVIEPELTSVCGNNRSTRTGVEWEVRYRVGRLDAFTETYLESEIPFRFPSVGKPTKTTLNVDANDIVDVPLAEVTQDGEVDSFDLNGDGWLDMLFVFSNRVDVHLKHPEHGTGWSSTPVDWARDPQMVPLGIGERLVLNSQIQESGHTLGRALYSMSISNFVDLNGDGLVDFVRACDRQTSTFDDYSFCGGDRFDPSGAPAPGHWQVWYNDGAGFADAPVQWSLPPDGSISWLSLVDEGEAQTVVCTASAGTLGGGSTQVIDPDLSELEINLEALPAFESDFTGDVLGEPDSDGDGMPDIADPDPDHAGELFGNNGSGHGQPDNPDVIGQNNGTLEDPFTFDNPVPDFPVGGRIGLATITGGCSGPDNLARGQRVLAKLVDWDADGRPDYVDAEAGLWYRNHGDGFGAARRLPTWMPRGFSEHWGVQFLVQDENALPDDSIPDSFVAEGHQQEMWRVQDWNHDGMLDLVVPYRHYDSGDPEESFPKGVTFGQYPPPGLLRDITVETGATTTIGYTSSIYMEPSGTNRLFSRTAAEYQSMPAPKHLVTSLEVEDPVTGQGATRLFTYTDGVCALGQCLGFETVDVRDFKSSPAVDLKMNDPRGVEWSNTVTEYLLARDYQVPQRVTVYTDHRRAHLPSSFGDEDLQPTVQLDHHYEQDPFDHSVVAVPSLWLLRRDVTEWAEDGPGTREFQVKVTRNPLGLPEQVVHQPAAVQDTITSRTEWLPNAAGDHFVPLRQWTEAWSHEAGGVVTVEEGRFAYDHGTYPQATHTRGLLTEQSVCADDPTQSLCLDTVEWHFDRTVRGSVFHVEGFDPVAQVVFEQSTIGAFAFGETVPVQETNALGHTTTRQVDVMGRVDGVTDSNGVVAEEILDTYGRSHATYRTGTHGPRHLLSTRQFETLQVPNHTVEHVAFRDDGTGRTRYEVYDGFGDSAQTWEPNVDGSGFIVTQSVSDVYGNAQYTSVPETIAQFAALPLTPPAERVDEAYYDSFGTARWTRTDLAEPSEVTYPAPGVSETRDAEGYRKQVGTDTLGRIVEVREGRGAQPLVPTGTYTYDGRGRVATFEDANRNRHRYRYDGAGRLRDVLRAGAGEPEAAYWSYDYVGPYVKTAYEQGTLEAVRWTYDALGRTTHKSIYQPHSHTWLDYTWTWDQLGTRAWNGVRHQISDPAGTTDYYYDESAPWGDLGRLTSLERVNDAVGHVRAFHYSYDFEGRTTSVEWPTGATVSTGYTPTGWKLFDGFTALGAGGTPLGGIKFTVFPAYDDRGILERWEVPVTDSKQGLGFDSLSADIVRPSPNRLAQVGYTFVDASTGPVQTFLTYDYLDNGWLRAKAIEPPFDPSDFIEYQYDPLGRARAMRFAQPLHTDTLERYTYDDAGNLTEFLQGFGPGQRHWLYDPPTRFGEIPTRVDSLTGDTDLHTYDGVGRMASWESDYGSGRVKRTFDYDGAGRLVGIDRDGEPTSLFYDVDDQLVYEERGADIYERFEGYRRGPDGEVVESVLPMFRLQTAASGTRSGRFVLTDLDGQALFTWDTDGQERSREITGIYGVPLIGPTWDVGETWSVDGLHGKEEDRQNSVVHFGARHTLFADGRWMQPEPLLATDLSKLDFSPRSLGAVYAGGNPIVWQDESGRYPEQARTGSLDAYLREVTEINANPTIGELGVISRSNQTSIRFVELDNGAIVDMKHFITAAQFTRRDDKPGNDLATIIGVMAAGSLTEQYQLFKMNPSAFSYEDMTSNLLGALYGDSIAASSSSNVLESVRTFLEADSSQVLAGASLQLGTKWDEDFGGSSPGRSPSPRFDPNRTTPDLGESSLQPVGEPVPDSKENE